ncbi:hypothetical protein Acr_24g0015520 [Actinidia rufa]|uniref:DUF7733 domain-containing protein n=1 Tax=Actinidia rufa TaxID=165716 RepID=A0A7J0GX53_9ERIC|nr:hypothetical protein Acr_24g0015520 [Actinidia rufa]
MSGVDVPPPLHEPDHHTTISKHQQNPRNRPGFFTFRHLTALATATLLFVSGMVNLGDLAFVLFAFIYMHFMSKFAFPTLSSPMERPYFGQKNKVQILYILVTAVIGLFLPIAYILEGIFDSDKEGIKAAAPHVFLLASQVFMEGVAFSDRFSTPIRIFIPVLYNSRRIFTIVEWLRAEIWKVDEGGYSGNTRRLYIGRGLAMANLALWCFNLFGLLLPVYLPKAFKHYYSGYKVRD